MTVKPLEHLQAAKPEKNQWHKATKQQKGDFWCKSQSLKVQESEAEGKRMNILTLGERGVLSASVFYLISHLMGQCPLTFVRAILVTQLLI